MKMLYRGKTKDVFEDGPETVRLVFTDRVTKNESGEIDPGGNIVAEETIPGQGRACFMMTEAVFSELARKNIARTHMVRCDRASLSMIALKAKLFSPGLEWVARWVCTGSFLRRYKMVRGISDGLRLPNPVFEITIKDDAAGDPPIVPSALIALGIVPAKTMDKLLEANAKALQAIREIFAKRGLDLWDIKIEWGLDKDGEPIIIDEISPGCCRAFDATGKQRVAGMELAQRFENG